MKLLILGFFVFIYGICIGQTDTFLQDVKNAYDMPGLQCSVKVNVVVPGIKMPEKNIFIEFRKGKKPKIKGAGIILLPKKGLLGQFNEILNSSSQDIFMGNDGDTAIYKIVSLDPKSDWVTADLKIYRPDKRIYFMDIITRDHGGFQVRHNYKEGMFPVKSIIYFDSESFKLPIKFLGRQDMEKVEEDAEGHVKGWIIMEYSDIVPLKE